MTPLDRLTGLHLAAIQVATARYLEGGNLNAWYTAMEKAISTAYTASYIASAAQRLGVPPDSPLLSRQRLSRAERADIARAIDEQLKYLRGFRADIEAGKLSPAQIAARANLYGSSLRSFYYGQRWGGWDIPQRLLPGMQACRGNCKCSVSVADNGDGTGVLTRVMGGGDAERHCSECPQLEGSYPVQRKRAA